MWQEVYRPYFSVPGYRKSEADKHILEIDPVTAPMVRHAFDLCLQGYGFRKIVLTLNEEKSHPRKFLLHGRWTGKSARRDALPERCDSEDNHSQRDLYRSYGAKQDGNGILQNHKQIAKPKSDWIRIENTHEPLRAQDT